MPTGGLPGHHNSDFHCDQFDLSRRTSSPLRTRSSCPRNRLLADVEAVKTDPDRVSVTSHGTQSPTFVPTPRDRASTNAVPTLQKLLCVFSPSPSLWDLRAGCAPGLQLHSQVPQVVSPDIHPLPNPLRTRLRTLHVSRSTPSHLSVDRP